MMGPNSLRLLEEILDRYPINDGMRVLDLGCGKGMTSLFLAKETNAFVFATDLWCDPTENERQFKKWGIDDQVIPIHADIMDLPYAHNFFNTIISIDSFHYFSEKPEVLEEKLLPLLKEDGAILIVMPGLKDEIHGNEPQLILDWIQGEEVEYEFYHSMKWWKETLSESSKFEIMDAFELNSFDIAWQEWFASGHGYSIRDKEFFKLGVDKYLAMIGLIIKKR